VIASKKMLAYAKAFSEGGIDAVTAQLKKDVTGDSSSPADIATVDAQDEKNKELRTSGANFLNSMSYWFESSTEKAERVAKETGMLKARGKQNIGADYQKQFGSKIDASVKKTKLKDLQKAEVQSYSRGGTTGSGIYGGYAGPTNNLSSANLGSAVTQNLGTTPTTTNAGTATAGQNQAAGSDAILTVIAGELQTNNALQKKILQASRN
jgi:hypothetical protein